ncbi:MAG: hydroxyacid dehydrogenase [Clostridia bacterium]|nr:hydroxyacid dehydrogenase [Clostridia bacterium]
MSLLQWLDATPDPKVTEEASRRLRTTQEPDRITVVLDDDPTGIQTIHGIYVYMVWDKRTLAQAISQEKAFFIQHNSRALPTDQAVRLNKEIMENLFWAADRTGKTFHVISRSDSTLRGHYPAETDAISSVIRERTGRCVDAEFLIPFFIEGGRITAEDIHYVRQDQTWIPVAETEFARDSAFGYHHSDLKRYIEEKSGGRIPATEVISISLDLLRAGDIDRLTRLLLSFENNRRVVVNATCYEDLKILTAALHEAERQGKSFLYRTAASFVKSYLQIEDQPLLKAKDLIENNGRTRGVLIVVGSHVMRTRQQLCHLIENTSIKSVPLSVPAILAGDEPSDLEIRKKAEQVESALKEGSSVVLYTSSTLNGKADPPESDQNQSLKTAERISAALVSIASRLRIQPSAVIAKGGITSSDLATKALCIRRCLALGQVLPGVPAVRCGPEAKWPGLPLIIFPGNVGSENALTDVYLTLHDGW